ncbi:type II toxin-antitoxin system Phd/YefM family antitoxin [Caldicellulosiruptor acetigenus]|nr:hypothetical protein [Caldicellulosiruptor acetigenus]
MKVGEKVMLINAEEFKENVQKFLEVAKREEVIIAEDGKPTLKIVPLRDNKNRKNNLKKKQQVFELIDKLAGAASDIKDIDVDKAREERILKIE